MDVSLSFREDDFIKLLPRPEPGIDVTDVIAAPGDILGLLPPFLFFFLPLIEDSLRTRGAAARADGREVRRTAGIRYTRLFSIGNR